MSSFNCFVVGLTGGIGSGKSTASQYFEQLGIQIVNADQVARDCVMPGTSALDEIINHFGKKIIDKNGNLNRSELRKIIFDNESAKLNVSFKFTIINIPPAIDKKGPNGNCRLFLDDLRLATIPKVMPRILAMSRILGIDCQPNQAPKADIYLKSPYPIPIFPVISLKSQNIDQRIA